MDTRARGSGIGSSSGRNGKRSGNRNDREQQRSAFGDDKKVAENSVRNCEVLHTTNMEITITENKDSSLIYRGSKNGYLFEMKDAGGEYCDIFCLGLPLATINVWDHFNGLRAIEDPDDIADLFEEWLEKEAETYISEILQFQCQA